MNEIILKRGKEESLKRFHPWVFSGAIAKVVLDKRYPHDVPEEGSIIGVRSHDGEWLGAGHWQIGSIAVRMIAFANECSFFENLADGFPRELLVERINTALGVRKAAGLLREDNNAFRLVHGEGDFLPGLVVDIYGNTAVVQAHSVGMHRERNKIAGVIAEVLPWVSKVYYKSSGTLPFKAPVPEAERQDRYITGCLESEDECVAVENGLTFGIDWLRGQKTGFFLDQRDNRALVEHYARGRKVLNMFCYTGGFSVYALRGGALSVHSVDVSSIATALAEQNVIRNFPDSLSVQQNSLSPVSCIQHQVFTDDAFHFFANPPQEHDGMEVRYDLVILDPPAFAKHRDAVKNALQGYKRLNAKAMEKIASGGILFTFSCSQAIDKEMFRLAVFSAAAITGRRVRILHQLHQPADHPVSIYHPEGEYLKGLVLYVE